MKWKHLFNTRITERGFTYYDRGHVTIDSLSANRVLATVIGTEIYNVVIHLEKDKIIQMDCNCPYAQGGNNCKHMAAALYAAENEWGNAPLTQEALANLEFSIGALSREALENILFTQAKNDLRLATQIIQASENKLSDNSYFLWQKNLSDILTMRSHGRINSDEFFRRLETAIQYTDEKFRFLLSRDMLWEAFELTEIFSRTVNCSKDDGYNHDYRIHSHLSEWWKTLYTKSDIDLRRKIFEWLHDSADELPEFYDDHIQKALIDIFTEQEFAKILLADIDNELSSVEDHNLDYRIDQRLTLMKHLDMSNQEMVDFLMPYSHCHSAVRLATQLLIADNRYEEAIYLLKDQKKQDKKAFDFIGHCSKTLIDLYLKTGRTQELAEELTYYVLNHIQDNLEYVHLLKKHISEDKWSALCRRLQRSASLRGIRDQLLVSEGLFEVLMDKIEVSSDTALLMRHERVLKKHLPERVRDFWLSAAEESFHIANDRNMYRTAAELLKKATAFPGGKEKASVIADNLRATFPRRTALLNELEKIKL